MAALIVTIMFIPQSLAYALFGTSSAPTVGPVAVASMITAADLGKIVDQGTMRYALAALSRTRLSGIIMLAQGADTLAAAGRLVRRCIRCAGQDRSCFECGRIDVRGLVPLIGG